MLIGEILRDRFSVREEDIRRALDIQKEVGGYIGQILIQTGSVTERQIIEALSFQLDLPLYTSDEDIAAEDILSFLQEKINITYVVGNGFVPVGIDHETNTLSVITSDPLRTPIIEYLARSLNYDLSISLAVERKVQEASRYYTASAMHDAIALHVDDSPEKLKDMAFEAPVIKYLNTTLSRAVELNASDIHVEPSENRFRIRFRIDGVLHEMDSVPESFYLALVSRIKLLSGLDIAEKRLPQDGKFSTRIGAALIDIRASTIPTARGEDVVIRLLYRGMLSFDLKTLGFREDHFALVRRMIEHPNGILLVTGPTGSGKTTTLYSVLSTLNNDEHKIITIEDPVEYQIDGLNQIHVKSDIGLTFASALRSILRHDPDIIMVGEIRDSETARISIQSALTGHLVFSTLHTNDSLSSLFRLLDMGIEDYLINASIIGIIAQRIIRLNCPHCSEETEIPEDVLERYGFRELSDRFQNENGSVAPKKGKGCLRCVGTGYRGRTSIFEIFEFDEELKEIFLRNHSLAALVKKLRERPYFRTLREDGFLKVLEGRTTVEEVLRIS